MQTILYIHIILTWFFSGLSLLTLMNGYYDPLMILAALGFAIGAAGTALMGKQYID
tara:strand:+ start:3689 stop:3856 length:168 start_codon:yes stop_codon:yes gene_type:complete